MAERDLSELPWPWLLLMFALLTTVVVLLADDWCGGGVSTPLELAAPLCKPLLLLLFGLLQSTIGSGDRTRLTGARLSISKRESLLSKALLFDCRR